MARVLIVTVNKRLIGGETMRTVPNGIEIRDRSRFTDFRVDTYLARNGMRTVLQTRQTHDAQPTRLGEDVTEKFIHVRYTRGAFRNNSNILTNIKWQTT